MQFRVSINVGPEGLPIHPKGFALVANIERDEQATWTDEERPVSGRRYIYLTDAENESEAEARAREIVGLDVRVRVTPYGRRVRS